MTQILKRQSLIRKKIKYIWCHFLKSKSFFISHFCSFLLQLLFESSKVFLLLKITFKICDHIHPNIILSYLIGAHNIHVKSPPVGISTHLLQHFLNIHKKYGNR